MDSIVAAHFVRFYLLPIKWDWHVVAAEDTLSTRRRLMSHRFTVAAATNERIIIWISFWSFSLVHLDSIVCHIFILELKVFGDMRASCDWMVCHTEHKLNASVFLLYRFKTECKNTNDYYIIVINFSCVFAYSVRRLPLAMCARVFVCVSVIFAFIDWFVSFSQWREEEENI